MTDVTPPHPPHPKQVAKGMAGTLKGHPTWVWVAGVTVLVGVAYFVWRNGRSAAVADTPLPVPDAPTGPVGGQYAYDDSLYPSATQGAFAGFSSPAPDVAPVDNAGAPETAPLVAITIPGPVTTIGDSGAGSSPTGKPVTGGGPPNGTTHAPPPKPKAPKPKATKKYTIKRGDTLSGIAHRFGTTVNHLMKLNPHIHNANVIKAGATITVPA